ncbi:transglutaminase domain-containing protein [bacterium]|nr:transglutaminase domain-containing protein [bacterium]
MNIATPETEQEIMTYLTKGGPKKLDTELNLLNTSHEYVGLEAIRMAFEDGDGAEFVVDTTYDGVELLGDTEFEQVLSAADWVAYHMVYESDPDPPGDVWTPSDLQFAEITIGEAGSGTGDCEDIAILLCAIMRFVIGVPANRVWVQAGIVTFPPLLPEDTTPPIIGHAYLVYKAKKGGIFYIEPQMGGYPYNPYRGAFPSITHWFFTPPVLMGAGESAQHRFNDQWSKGGGDYLHNPNYIN